MKAVIIEDIKKFSIKEVAYPRAGQNEVIVQVKACCVCGTDIHLLDGEFKGANYPLIPGHEFSGVVSEVGKGVFNLKPGDRVAIEPFISCETCYFCKIGKNNLCLNGNVIGHSASNGIKLDGGFAEYTVVPARNLVKLADNVSYDEGSFIANLGTVVYAVKRARLYPGMRVLIFGAGANGLLLAQLSKRSGASTVVVTARNLSRLQVAQGMDVDFTVMADKLQDTELKKIAPTGFDIIFEATGSAEVAQSTFEYVKNGGKIILYGIVPPQYDVSINPFEICRRNLEVIGSFSSVHSCFVAHELLKSKVVHVKPLISHHFPLAEWAKAQETARNTSECMRVVVTPT